MNSTEPVVLVLGTRNPKKGRELAELIAPPWEPAGRLSLILVRRLDDDPGFPDPVEDAATFAGNARKKASETARQLGQWCLADDSGLAVDALGGGPGIYSARYAGAHGDDHANNQKLIQALADTPAQLRGAAFCCALALADPGGEVRLEAEGSCRGRILDSPRGDHGFGYDPLFLIPEYHQTFGELSTLVKQHLGHRARAFGRLRNRLADVLNTRY